MANSFKKPSLEECVKFLIMYSMRAMNHFGGQFKKTQVI